jgi:hypothetical protein
MNVSTLMPSRQLRKKMGVLLVPSVVVSLTIGFSLESGASSNYPLRANTAVQALYGATAGFGGSCTTCHGGVQPNIPPNSFGSQFVANGGQGGNSTQVAQFQTIFTAIKDLDPDADTHSNEAEFKGNSDPGDALSKPPTGPTPTPTPTPTPKPSATPTPSPTGQNGKQNSSSFAGNVVGGCGSSKVASQNHTDASLLVGGWGALILVFAPLLLALGLRRRGRDE